MQLDNPVLMARIGGPHGIKGEVRVKSFGNDPLTLGDYGSLYSGDGRKFKIVRMRASKSVLVVKFKGINFRDEAEPLNGTDLYVDRSMLPDDIDDDEFYVTDLIGCHVVDPQGAAFGTVLDVVNFGAGDLVEIMPAGSGQSILIEFTRTNVPAIDLDAKSIVVELPNEVSERDQ